MGQATSLSAASPGSLSELPRAPGGRPLIGHAWSLRRRPFAFLESLRSVGAIVRVDIGKMPVYMLTRPELVHAILVTQARHVGRGGEFFEQVRTDLVTEKALGTFEREPHLRRRRLMQPALHRNHVDAFVGLMHDHTRALSDSWHDGESIELDQAMSDLVTDNTAGSMFGLSHDSEMIRTVRQDMPVLTHDFLVRLLAPKVLKRFPIPAIRRFNGALGELRQVMDRIVAERMDSPDGGDDLLGMLLAATDPDTDRPLSQEEVQDELTLALFAGIFTTATTLSWLFYELDRYPEIEARVVDEVRTVLDGGASLGEALGQLHYTRRVVQEVLRLHPVLMFIRQVSQPLELGGVALPAGTDLGYSPYTLHRDPEIYPDPARLDPDRWLPERARSVPPGGFLSFGEGRHRCIGEFFAWAEILVAICVLLPRWKLRLAPGQAVHEVNGVHPRPSSLRMIAIERRGPGAHRAE
jgi:cytochrome P450